jgi:hypothetical protein
MSESAQTTTAEPQPSPPTDPGGRFASLLATGERVLLVRQRHWLTFLEAGRWFALSLGIGFLVLVLDQSVPDDGVAGFLSTILDWGFWLFFLIGVAGVGWYLLAWRVERYLVTTRRVIETGGVINKYSRDTSLQALTDMIVGHPWLGRIVGYGEIVLLTASEAGTTKIRFLPDADGFKKALLDATHEHDLEVGGGRALQEAIAVASAPPSEPPGASAPPPPTPAAMSADEIDSAITRLADMRDRGLITQEEFDEKKRQLLDRL